MDDEVMKSVERLQRRLREERMWEWGSSMNESAQEATNADRAKEEERIKDAIIEEALREGKEAIEREERFMQIRDFMNRAGSASGGLRMYDDVLKQFQSHVMGEAGMSKKALDGVRDRFRYGAYLIFDYSTRKILVLDSNDTLIDQMECQVVVEKTQDGWIYLEPEEALVVVDRPSKLPQTATREMHKVFESAYEMCNSVSALAAKINLYDPRYQEEPWNLEELVELLNQIEGGMERVNEVIAGTPPALGSDMYEAIFSLGVTVSRIRALVVQRIEELKMMF